MTDAEGILHNPSLSGLFYYPHQGDPRLIDVIHELGISPEPGNGGKSGDGDETQYRGLLSDGTPCSIASGLAHDTRLLQVTLKQPGVQPAGAWGKMKTSLDGWMEQNQRSGSGQVPWAASLVFHAVLPEKLSQNDLLPDLTDPAGPALPQNCLSMFETLPFGWFLCGADHRERLIDSAGYRWRELVLLTPRARAERVLTHFLEPLVQGLPRIELYLHKSRHHADQQVIVRGELGNARDSLQESMRLALQTTDLSHLHREQEELEAISAHLMRFQTQKAYAEVLLNTLEVNVGSFEDHLNRVKLRSKAYDHELASLRRHIDQLQSDLLKARTVAESTYTFQDLQRSVEASRFTRASYLMSSTAGLLAGIAVFNSFLDIWNLSVNGSGLVLPPAGLRITLGLLAGVSWPLAAYGIVIRRRVVAVIWSGLGMLTLLGALISTLIVNT